MNPISFMLAEDYDVSIHGERPMVLMPKLNGVRARFVPGRGFVSRGGQDREQKDWHPAKLAHIKVPSGYEFDGELYVHGWSLQRINGAVSVNSSEVTVDTLQVEYHIYDLPSYAADALQRMQMLDKIQMGQACKAIFWKDGCTYCFKKKANAFKAWVADGYEGMILKEGRYVDGRTQNLLKMKAWKDGEFKFIGLEEGLGKRAGMTGKVVLATPSGIHFRCGTGFSDELAHYWWQHRGNAGKMPRLVKIRFLNLSEGGTPLNNSFMEAIYE